MSSRRVGRWCCRRAHCRDRGCALAGGPRGARRAPHRRPAARRGGAPRACARGLRGARGGSRAPPRARRGEHRGARGQRRRRLCPAGPLLVPARRPGLGGQRYDLTARLPADRAPTCARCPAADARCAMRQGADSSRSASRSPSGDHTRFEDPTLDAGRRCAAATS
jgi:hypothetical protein